MMLVSANGRGGKVMRKEEEEGGGGDRRMLNPRLVSANDDHQLFHSEPPTILRLASNSLSTRCSRLLGKSPSIKSKSSERRGRRYLVERDALGYEGDRRESRMGRYDRGSVARRSCSRR